MKLSDFKEVSEPPTVLQGRRFFALVNLLCPQCSDVHHFIANLGTSPPIEGNVLDLFELVALEADNVPGISLVKCSVVEVTCLSKETVYHDSEAPKH